MTQVLNTTSSELVTLHGFVFQPGLNTLTDEQVKQAGEDPMVKRWTDAGFLADPASVVVTGGSTLNDAERAELEQLRALHAANQEPPAGDLPTGDTVTDTTTTKAKAKDKDQA